MADALVLGGGGVAGIAWIIGVLTGLAEAGQVVTEVDEIVGTSAGSNVAAQLGSGLDLQALYLRQTEPGLQAAEISVDVDVQSLLAQLGAAVGGAGTFEDIRRAIGRFALDAATVPEARRRAVIESRLPSHQWPARTLKIVAVDAESGEPRVFDSASGVSLVDAVAASSAVPGIWPPVTIDGRRYVDGGVRSNDNADLASGASRVLILAPLGGTQPLPSERPLTEAVERLRAAGAKAIVIGPDVQSIAAISTNPLDPSTRRPAAEAGRSQGRSLRVEWSRPPFAGPVRPAQI